MKLMGAFEDLTKDELLNQFDFKEDRDKINIIFANYNSYQYEGDAFVLFEKDNELFIIEASHCSCYELEGMWSPMGTDLKTIRFMIEKGKLGDHYGVKFKDELLEIINSMDN